MAGTCPRTQRRFSQSPEAIAAVEMYGQLLSKARPAGLAAMNGNHVLDDFLQGRTSFGIASSKQLLDRHFPQSAKRRVTKQCSVCVFPHKSQVRPRPFQGCPRRSASIPKSRNKRAGFLFLAVATSNRPTLAADRRSGLATTRLSAWSIRGLQQAFAAHKPRCGPDQLAECRCRPRQGDTFSYPQSRPSVTPS